MDGQTKPLSARSSKIDPSFKSKRYRDKLRTEIKGLEGLIPIDRSSLHRKLDSQTVFRLIISFFRLKMFFKIIGLKQQQLSDNETTAKDDSLGNVGGKQVLQCLDGFLLAAFADGTIVYSTDNVLQYLGFNQVDLMHRCLYGLVHPEDHQDLKNILENSYIKDVTKQHPGCNWRQVSFICRMKCFNGTSAGYLKIHCSGSIQRPNDSNQSKSSPDVVLLYCQPFMLTGSDIVEDFKQNVFWSKHDMGLTIKEFDKKSEEMIGYGDDDLKEKSFYQFVHPEDLATFAACHKTLTESTEVQTMYFRMESKEGSWVWLHSRGKVICKNSKKFSIVFTHCPVREEDSTFLQQESTLRQRYAMNDLLYFIQFGSSYAPCSGETDDTFHEDQQGTSKIGSFCTPHMGFTEDLSMTFYNSLDPCPSSWHSMTDRHSPVLPSTHVAHKITQREKQIQFQEFKRRQQMFNQPVLQDFACSSPNYQYHPTPVNPQFYSYNQISPETIPECINGVTIKTEHVGDYPRNCSNPIWTDQRNSPVGNLYTNISPPSYHSATLMNNYGYCQNDPSTVHQKHYPGTHLQYDRYQPQTVFHASSNYYPQEVKFPVGPWIKPEITRCNEQDITRVGVKRPSASIKVSMNCDYTGLVQNQGSKYTCTDFSHNRPSVTNTGLTSNVVHYDIEASVHMKIVENTCRDTSCARIQTKKTDADLPSIGSIFEFLNDGQV